MSKFSDPAANLATLIACPSVTPAEGGALAALEAMLKPLGFRIERPVFSDEGTPDIENLYAKLGDQGPHLMFAGHTDVVPVGNETDWTHPPFSAAIADGMMYGRGAVDMKGGIACFIAAVARQMETHGRPKGSVSLLITGDEEGPAINGTDKLLRWAAERGETWDASIVGEPTNPDRLGDTIKIGRRGSISARLTVHGKQGHAAYPHLADNPVPGMVTLLEALLSQPIDAGTTEFQPTNLEVTSVDVGNRATNVIPAAASAIFNIRFNDSWSADSLKTHIAEQLAKTARERHLRPYGHDDIRYELEWLGRPSPVFLTRDERLIETLSAAVTQITKTTPKLSTSGGTSDARFIKDYCPVVEFGLVGQTMHMVDERVALADLETLTQIYGLFIANWFERQ
ncbi:succinyl-diaminopimelate desuccinylase [Limoniibacter endophyticus]|uniref:Succinyl-diaminopimelate desuccinylase n=1 Tax=Limoniibacter endophyticus TaxID=1565040 RepID=A0A8J3DHJ5_9HYPH|nr:succinyl-diaminopimelate desuccinylase [Limoniibacter endophyticus]GHC67339.1 succinyl-diaminopimelate desuccinylase [Limoniibacter endophyticus]